MALLVLGAEGVESRDVDLLVTNLGLHLQQIPHGAVIDSVFGQWTTPRGDYG